MKKNKLWNTDSNRVMKAKKAMAWQKKYEKFQFCTQRHTKSSIII